MRKEPWTLVFFLVFIAIGVFVLMNLITAVIVENAFSIAKEDEEEMAKQMLQRREEDIGTTKLIWIQN